MKLAEITLRQGMHVKDIEFLRDELIKIVGAVAVALPSRDEVDGYNLGGVYELIAYRFEYPEKVQEALQKLVFKWKLKHQNVKFKILF